MGKVWGETLSWVIELLTFTLENLEKKLVMNFLKLLKE